ncbi:hypothetical protein HK405_001312, partial [Cladochytrium tenue]
CFENYLNVRVVDVVRRSAGAVSQTKVEQMLEWLVFHNSAPASAGPAPRTSVPTSPTPLLDSTPSFATYTKPVLAVQTTDYE